MGFFPKENKFKEHNFQTSHRLKCVVIIAKELWKVSLDLAKVFRIYGTFTTT